MKAAPSKTVRKAHRIRTVIAPSVGELTGVALTSYDSIYTDRRTRLRRGESRRASPERRVLRAPQLSGISDGLPLRRSAYSARNLRLPGMRGPDRCRLRRSPER